MARAQFGPLLLSLWLIGAAACGDSDPALPGDAATLDAATAADLGTSDAAITDSSVGVDAAVDASSDPDLGIAADLGANDAAEPDAAEPDAAEPDAAEPDAAEPDAAEPDAAEPDAAEPDAAEPDAAEPDAGPADSGPRDTGPADTGPADTGPADAGAPSDAGTVVPACIPAMSANDACGGDPVGNWTYVDACVDPAVFAEARDACPSIGINQLSASEVGTISLQANLTFNRNTTASFVYDVTVPLLCSFFIGNCNDVEDYIEASIPATNSVATCSNRPGGGCGCNVLVEQISIDSGTYTVDSPNGRIVANGQEYYYCVMGDALLYKGTAANQVDGLISHVLVR